MTSVKWPCADEVHAPLLMGLLFRQVGEAFAQEDWAGLRQSHFRVLSAVPSEGLSVTDLAGRLGMTKQGCGQFVTQLTSSGHLEVVDDPDDRRVRRVGRTDLGDRTVRAVTARMLAIEEAWAETVGERRYQTFREVLEELALRG